MVESATVDHEGMKFEVSSNHLTQEELRGEPAKPAEAPAKSAEVVPVAEKAAAAEAEVETPEVELTPEQAASEAGKALQKKRGSYQTRIDELTKAKYETQGELNAARAEVERLQKALEATTAAPKPAEQPAAAPVVPAKPKLEDFAGSDDPYAAYIEALSDWKTDRRIEALEEKQNKTQAEREEKARLEREQSSAHSQRRTVVEAHNARVAEFVKGHPDYQQVLDSTPEFPSSPSSVTMFQYIEHAEMGPELAYHLSSHHDELLALVALPPARVLAALGKLEGRLEAQAPPPGQAVAPATTTTPAAPVSKAKPPLKVVGSSPVAVSDDDEPAPDAPYSVHAKYYNEKDRKAGLRV